MVPFVAVALSTAEKMEIADNKGRQILMRFCKIYPPEKIGYIIGVAKQYAWWHSNPTAAFMKAVSATNAEEKEFGPLWQTLK